MADFVIEFDVPEEMRMQLLYFISSVEKFKKFDPILEKEVEAVSIRFSGDPEEYIKWCTEDKNCA